MWDRALLGPRGVAARTYRDLAARGLCPAVCAPQQNGPHGCGRAARSGSVRRDPVIVRLRGIPGIGLLTATALVGTVGHIHAFRRARQFASWLGLTPREHSSGPRLRLGGITKCGDVYLRCLLTHGARAVLLAAHRRALRAESLTRVQQWALRLQERRGHNKATIAVANKLGRIVWAVWHRDVPFADAPAV